jgi:hypothetical protein
LQEARKRRHSAIDDDHDDDHDRTSIQIPEAQHTRSDQSEGASTRKFKAFHTDTGKKTPEKEQMPSTSSGALETNDNDDADDDKYKFSSLPSTVCDLNEMGNLFATTACPECHLSTVRLCEDTNMSRGMAVCLKAVCTNCRTIIGSSYTSATLPASNGCFEVTRRTTLASVMCGFGADKLNKFCEYLNIPGMNSKTFHSHFDTISTLNPDIKRQLLELSVQTVREAHKELSHPNLNDTDVLDIAVSYDGTWMTRGHSSLIGVACAIDLVTGICVDYHVMSKHCHKCATTGKKLQEIGPNAHEAWFQKHKPNCKKNFDGSSGMMEVEGAKVLWSRSVAQHNLRYTVMLSDGDCKSHTELCKLHPYGPDVKITKEECINHVAKRVGTALRNLVADYKKRKITLGGRQEGALTNKVINKLQKYYAKAIRSNTHSVTDMENAVWGTVFHCCSTDEDPHHHRCQKGAESWCFYQRALARREPIPPHKEKLGSAISKKVFHALVPVYKKLGSPDLLRRCMHSKTQNANESLHGVIWSRCPKASFASLPKVELATLVSVGEFNMGATASQNFMAAHGLNVGYDSVRLGRRRDRQRATNSRRSTLAKQKYRRKKIQEAKRKARMQQELEEGGPAYAAGAF